MIIPNKRSSGSLYSIGQLGIGLEFAPSFNVFAPSHEKEKKYLVFAPKSILFSHQTTLYCIDLAPNW